MTQSSSSADVASVLKAKLQARLAMVKRDLLLRGLGPKTVDEFEYLFRSNDLYSGAPSH